MNPSPQTDLVICPDCGCDVRADRLEKHLRKVHGKATKPRTPKKKKHKLINHIEVRRAEARLAAYAHTLATAPRKCAIESCSNKVIPPEAYCDSCKQKQMPSTEGMSKKKRWLELCDCGAPVMPGETRCYSCIGD